MSSAWCLVAWCLTPVAAYLIASDPPTTGIVIDVPSRSIVSFVPGSGQSVNSLSVEKIISAICLPAGIIWSSGSRANVIS